MITLSQAVPTDAQFAEIENRAEWSSLTKGQTLQWWAYKQAHPDKRRGIIYSHQVDATFAVRDLVLLGRITVRDLEEATPHLGFYRPFSNGISSDNAIKEAFKEQVPQWATWHYDWLKAKQDALWLIKAGFI